MNNVQVLKYERDEINNRFLTMIKIRDERVNVRLRILAI